MHGHGPTLIQNGPCTLFSSDQLIADYIKSNKADVPLLFNSLLFTSQALRSHPSGETPTVLSAQHLHYGSGSLHKIQFNFSCRS